MISNLITVLLSIDRDRLDINKRRILHIYIPYIYIWTVMPLILFAIQFFNNLGRKTKAHTFLSFYNSIYIYKIVWISILTLSGIRFSEIPGRWRRHCPHGPMMSGSGCNLVGEGIAAVENGNAAAAGKCVCGPSVPWCPGEPRPYMYMTRHECRLNLEAKIAYGRTHSFHMRAYCDIRRCPRDAIRVLCCGGMIMRVKVH